jgi:hypothetical protein
MNNTAIYMKDLNGIWQEAEQPADRTMKTLTHCLEQALADGYRENFTVIGNGLATQSARDKRYPPGEVHILNFYRFEGESNPDDMAILYTIQTTDGMKGTLVDAYGTYADSGINAFILQVEDIHKRGFHEGKEPSLPHPGL